MIRCYAPYYHLRKLHKKKVKEVENIKLKASEKKGELKEKEKRMKHLNIYNEKIIEHF